MSTSYKSMVVVARANYETQCQKPFQQLFHATEEVPLSKKIDILMTKICQHMARKGSYNMSIREIKYIHGPYLTMPTYDKDLWPSDLSRDFGKFCKVASEAGLKLAFRWDYSFIKHGVVATGIKVTFAKTN